VIVDSPTIGSLLRSLRDLQAILVHVKRLAALQQVYTGAIPGALARRSRVAYERAGTLVVVADTGAVAAKLRQLVPRIVVEIVKSAPEITSIRVEVQVTHSRAGTTPRARIGAAGKRSLQDLRDALPDSPLRHALERMLRRRGKSDGDDQPFQGEKGDDDQG
jgi:hypothetical protein